MILNFRILLIWMVLACFSMSGRAAAQTTSAGGSVPENSGSASASVEPERQFDEVHVLPRLTPESNKPEPSDTALPPLAKSSAAGGRLKIYTKPIRVDVDLVLVPVTVNDSMNRVVMGLERDQFALFDSGKPQEIKYFSSEDAPISVGVILDVSGSMESKMAKAREAVVDFFKTANPEDEFFLITFSDAPEVLSDFTGSPEDIESKLVFVQPKGRTALLDAIYLGVSKMRRAKYERKALLIISDGGDNHSRYTEREIKSLVREADVQIYALGIFSLEPQVPEEMEGPQLLSDVTEVTGGRMLTVDDPKHLAAAAAKIGAELRNQYVLGYRPSNSVHDGKWRKIKVKLHPPKGSPPLTVYARTGYYAPNE